MVSVMSGAREMKQALTSSEIMRSRREVDDFMVESILERSAVVMGEKVETRWSEDKGSVGSETGVVAEEIASWLWMFSILELKNDMRLSHFSGVKEDKFVVGFKTFV